MSELPPIEIPPAVRELAEQNVAQTRAAYAAFLTLAKQAQDMVAASQGDSARGVGELQAKATRYAEENVEASFRLASELAQARDLQEYAEIQSRYAQTQVITFGQQAKTLTRLLSEAAETAGNWAGRSGTKS